MKKFSINLLKVSLLLIIGLCMFGMTSQVEAAKKVVNETINIKVGETVEKSPLDDSLGYIWAIDVKDSTVATCKTNGVKSTYYLYDEYDQGVKITGNKVGSTTIEVQFSRGGNCWGHDDIATYTVNVTSNNVTFTLNYNDGVNSNNKKSESVKDTDGSITIVDYSKKISKSGYELIGWSKDKNSTEAEYEIGDKLTIKEGETLYAIWKARDIYTIQYGNGKLDKNTKEIKFDAVDSQAKKINAKWSINSGSDYATLSDDEGESVTLKAKDNVKGKVKIKIEYNGKSFVTDEIEVNTKESNDPSVKNPATSKTLKDSKGNEIKKDTKLKFVENSTYDAWTLRNGTKFPVSSNTKLGDIENGDIVQVTEITSVSGSTGTFLKVKVISGSAKGEEGYIYYDNNAQKLFEITTDVSTEDDKSDDKQDQQPVGEIDFSGFDVDTEGIMSIVFEMISKLFTFLVEKVLPTVGPMVESAANTLLPLVGQVIGGILQ